MSISRRSSGAHTTLMGSLAVAALLIDWRLNVAPASAANVDQGRRLASHYCARCHSIDKTQPSPLAGAPPFRTLHERYPVDTLQEALAEGIVTGHPDMPEFRFDPTQIGDFLAFLKTLE